MPPEGRIGTLADYLDRQARKAAENMRKTLFSAVISAGGLLIRDDGAFQIISADGSFTLYARRGSDGKREFGLLRDNGTYVLRTFSVAGGNQAWALHDNNDGIVFSDDAVSGGGIARPWFPLPAVRARYSDWPASTAADFERVWNLSGYRQHPKCLLSVRHTTTTDPATTGEVRVVVGGTTVQTIPVQFAVATTTLDPFVIPGQFGDGMTIGLDVRRTGGTGEVRCEPAYAWTVQS